MFILNRRNIQQLSNGMDDVIEMLNKECAKSPDHCPEQGYKIIMLLAADTIMALLRCCFFLLAGGFLVGLFLLLHVLFVG